jgi:lactose/L-arabinose transport system permease protein
MIKGNKAKMTGVFIFMLIAFVVSAYPFYAMIINATSTNKEIFSGIPRFLPGSNLVSNFKALNERIPIVQNLINSIFVSFVSTSLQVLICALSGFAFAKFNFKGKNVLFIIIMATMMIPGQVTLIPLFILMAKFGWIDTYSAVILPSLVNAFGVFFMRQNMLNFPTEIIEAYKIDGCSHLRGFFQIILPTMKPTIAVLSILTFMGSWGNFMWPMLVLNSPEKYTLPVALRSLVAVDSAIDYGQIMTGTLLSVIPVVIIFIAFQRYFIDGLMGGAVKG